MRKIIEVTEHAENTLQLESGKLRLRNRSIEDINHSFVARLNVRTVIWVPAAPPTIHCTVGLNIAIVSQSGF